MSRDEEKYIIPLTIELDEKIEHEVYFLKLPSIIKEKLMRLEELSRNGKNNRGRYIREKHNLPLNSLKKLFISYLNGVTDMKAVSANTDDSRWLISTEKIDIDSVIKIMKVWIEAFYIEESELEKKRENDENVKLYARQVIEQLSIEHFRDSSYSENIILFDQGEVVDQDGYSLLPLIAMKYFIGNEVTVHGHSSKWFYSQKGEIVTDPMSYRDKKEEDRFSFVVRFSVQTLPPWNRPYLNIYISSRRWVSKNESQKIFYYEDKKSVYMKTSDYKLQVMHAQYNYMSKDYEWSYADKKSYNAIYMPKDQLKYSDIIMTPEKYMTGEIQKDAYVVFEYGMKDGKKQMHSQDAGISHMDRCEIFNNVIDRLKNFSSQNKKIAEHIDGNKGIIKPYFDSNFMLSNKKELLLEFKENIDVISKGKKIVIEICYSSGQEILRNQLKEILEKQLEEMDVEIKVRNIFELSERLECIDPRKKQNLEGYNKRIKEIELELEKTEETVISIVIIHQPDYYKLEGKVNKKVDPKNALRVGFANTGRLTQFITIESFEEKEKERLKALEKTKSKREDGNYSKTCAFNMVIRSTVLDVYRQLGIHNYFVKSEKKSTLKNKIAVGIYIVNFKNLINDIQINQFPIIVSCNLMTHEIMVETELVIVSKFNYKREKVISIRCAYSEFPIQFRKIIKNMGSGKRLEGSERFLLDWFEDLDEDLNYEIMIVADGNSRKVIEGISNKEIMKNYDTSLGNISKIGINGRLGFEIDLTEYDNIDLLRIRNNDEVPDYIPKEEESKGQFQNTSGIYKFESVYYSQDVRPLPDDRTFKFDSTKIGDNKAFLHRNIIEIYPMYSSDREKECVHDIHNLRKASIQYEAGKTVLPMPLHIAKLLEEYII